MKEEELAAAAEVRQERDVLAQMVRTLQERERERQTAPAPGAQLKAHAAAQSTRERELDGIVEGEE